MKKYINILIFIVFGAFITTSIGNASILGFEELKVDFTQHEEAQKKADWSQKKYLDLTEDGLGWEGDSKSSRDVWVETAELLAVGVSWRAAQSSNVKFEVEFAKTEAEDTYHHDRVFVRHSPDAKNWSSWQELERNLKDEVKKNIQLFHGTVGVPYSETQIYYDYLSEYQKMDVPWASDEEAALKWILSEKNPQYLEEHLPFVGYMQFHYETQLRGGERLKRIKIQANYGVGGIHSIPKDENVYQEHQGPWRFRSP